jgi:hypothetical protein
MGACSPWTEITYSYKLSRLLSSLASFTTFPSALSRSNLARTDSSLLLTGEVCKSVILCHRSMVRSLTSGNFSSASKDALMRPVAISVPRSKRTGRNSQSNGRPGRI